ncbi:MAG: riboflavin kinase [Patescibacteria group bacterium]
MLYALCILFQAHVIPGSGIARKQNIPTLNLSLDDVPSDLQEGIYACRVSFEQTNKPVNQQTRFSAVMHYGPRPVHNLPLSCEVHVLDQSVSDPPASVDVMIVERIRAIQSFEHIDALKSAIQNDIAQARAILSA